MAAWAILSERNMCVYTYTKMKQLKDWMECKNMQIMFLDEYYLIFVKYMQEKTPSDILELCWEKAKFFEKVFKSRNV